MNVLQWFHCETLLKPNNRREKSLQFHILLHKENTEKTRWPITTSRVCMTEHDTIISISCIAQMQVMG